MLPNSFYEAYKILLSNKRPYEKGKMVGQPHSWDHRYPKQNID